MGNKLSPALGTSIAQIGVRLIWAPKYFIQAGAPAHDADINILLNGPETWSTQRVDNVQMFLFCNMLEYVFSI